MTKIVTFSCILTLCLRCCPHRCLFSCAVVRTVERVFERFLATLSARTHIPFRVGICGALRSRASLQLPDILTGTQFRARSIAHRCDKDLRVKTTVDEEKEETRSPGGQPGNNNAGKNRPWIKALTRAVAQDDGKRLRKAAEKLLDLASEGDVPALRELGDRLDGKSIQRLAGEVDEPIRVIVEGTK